MTVNHKSQIDCEAVAKAPLLSVVMLSYNQELYIRKAIESILAQQTDFAYELIIADDCSTDQTRDICIEYQKTHPDVIRLVLRETNVGVRKNAILSITNAMGKYIAFCEGDDFWLDPCKLQRQYDLLESNPKASGAHTRVNYCDANEQIIATSTLFSGNSEKIDFNYLLQRNVIHTCSFIFRTSILDAQAFSVLEQSPIPDYALFLITALRGEVLYLPTITATYRKNAGISATWTFSSLLRDRLKIYALLEKHFDLSQYRGSLYTAKQFHYFHLFSMPQKGWNNIIKCCYGASLIWYTTLSSMWRPNKKTNRISGKAVVKLFFKSRFRFKNWRNYIKTNNG